MLHPADRSDLGWIHTPFDGFFLMRTAPLGPLHMAGAVSVPDMTINCWSGLGIRILWDLFGLFSWLGRPLYGCADVAGTVVGDGGEMWPSRCFRLGLVRKRVCGSAGVLELPLRSFPLWSW
jgi:hypothetical protein